MQKQRSLQIVFRSHIEAAASKIYKSPVYIQQHVHVASGSSRHFWHQVKLLSSGKFSRGNSKSPSTKLLEDLNAAFVLKMVRWEQGG